MFADLYTVIICMNYFDIFSRFLLIYETPRGKLFNTIVFFLLYLIAVLALIWLLYKCYVFLRARNAHDEMRRIEKEREKQTLLERFKTIIPQPDFKQEEQQELSKNTTKIPFNQMQTEYQLVPTYLEQTLDPETIKISEKTTIPLEKSLLKQLQENEI